MNAFINHGGDNPNISGFVASHVTRTLSPSSPKVPISTSLNSDWRKCRANRLWKRVQWTRQNAARLLTFIALGVNIPTTTTARNRSLR